MKRVHIYYLLDASSESLNSSGKRISELVDETIPYIKSIKHKFKANVVIKIITYGTGAKWYDNTKCKLDYWIDKNKSDNGESKFGSALELLGTDISNIDETVCPIIIHLPSVNPTDDYSNAIKELSNLQSYIDAMKISIISGDGISHETMYGFTGSNGRIINAEDHSMIKDLLLFFVADYYETHPEDYYKLKFEELDLSVRVTTTFKRTGAVTVGDFLKGPKRSEEMIGDRHVGKYEMQEAVERLAEKLIELGYLSYLTKDELIIGRNSNSKYTEFNLPERDNPN